jgi:glutathione S-transferase
MAPFQLYYREGSSSMVIEAALATIGAEYVLVPVSDKDKESGGILARLNPAAKIPVLVLPDGTAVSESMAILMLLDEIYPAANLMPKPGSTDRAFALQWLAFMASSTYPKALQFYYAARYTTATDQPGIDAVRDAAGEALGHDLGLIAKAIRGPYFLGGTWSILDVYAAMLADWHAPAMAQPLFQALRSAIVAHPAIRKAWMGHDYAL